MTNKERDGYIVGCYRRLGELIDLLKAGGRADAKAEPEPREQTLPGFAAADWTPPQIEAEKPREWCNTVKVYEVLFEKCGLCCFDLAELVENEAIRNAIRDATGNRVGVASYSRVLSTLHRAGALSKKGRNGFFLNEPTDELREAVERTAKKRAAAKEVSA